MNHQWSIKKLCFEFDTDPYYQALDDKVKVSVQCIYAFLVCPLVTIVGEE